MTETAPHARRVEPDPAVVVDFAADYVDSFAIETSPAEEARTWADASLHGSRGVFGSVVWHGLLRFDLAREDEARTAFGWQLTTEQERLMVMDIDGPLAAGRMVFAVTDDMATWSTMLRFHGRTGRVLWATLGHGHRALAPVCLDRASAHLGTVNSNRGAA